MDILEFAKQLNPRLEEMYEIFSNPQALLGKTVYANRAGFSCGSEGGTKMILKSIDGDLINFVPSPESTRHSGSSWGSTLKNLHFDVRLSK